MVRPGEIPAPPAEFHLPPQAAGLFDTDDPNSFYFIIKRATASELARSTNAPSETNVCGWPSICRTWQHRCRELSRDLFHSAISVDIWRNLGNLLIRCRPVKLILVGCSIAPELKELRLLALKLVGCRRIDFTAWPRRRLVACLRGRIRPIEDISATAVKISAGDLSQRINVAETESELGQLAAVLNSTFARLEAAFAQQKQFASDAAHELRTPVSVMLTQTQTALNRERSAPEYRETVEACQRAAQRMRRLIESLLELARLDAGQEQMKRLRFDLSQTAWDCVELVRPLADERGVKIHCDLPPVEVTGDAERLAQVVTNLLTNAIQYNRANGEVRISVKLQGSMILLTVSDTGPGISSEDLPHVFERFYRADQSRSSGQTGLGLAISKAIVEAHGGTIEVSSKPTEPGRRLLSCCR